MQDSLSIWSHLSEPEIVLRWGRIRVTYAVVFQHLWLRRWDKSMVDPKSWTFRWVDWSYVPSPFIFKCIMDQNIQPNISRLLVTHCHRQLVKLPRDKMSHYRPFLQHKHSINHMQNSIIIQITISWSQGQMWLAVNGMISSTTKY